ncbi:MAG: hypothetical protein IPL12_09295 [Bacteroidetes bacterium]|nr:hypothetical protein [Bacteroidota bacterium]
MQSGREFTEGFAYGLIIILMVILMMPGEYVFNSVTASIDVINGSAAIPYLATAGNARMRIRCAFFYEPFPSELRMRNF